MNLEVLRGGIPEERSIGEGGAFRGLKLRGGHELRERPMRTKGDASTEKRGGRLHAQMELVCGGFFEIEIKNMAGEAAGQNIDIGTGMAAEGVLEAEAAIFDAERAGADFEHGRGEERLRLQRHGKGLAAGFEAQTAPGMHGGGGDGFSLTIEIAIEGDVEACVAFFGRGGVQRVRDERGAIGLRSELRRDAAALPGEEVGAGLQRVADVTRRDGGTCEERADGTGGRLMREAETRVVMSVRVRCAERVFEQGGESIAIQIRVWREVLRVPGGKGARSGRGGIQTHKRVGLSGAWGGGWPPQPNVRGKINIWMQKALT